MLLNNALEHLMRDQLLTENERRPLKLVIPLFSPGKVGGQAYAEVNGIFPGFDWDAGKVFLTSEKPLTQLSPEDVAAIRTSVSMGQSWHAYERYKKQKAKEDRVKELLTKVRAHLDTRADFCSTYPPGTHPLNDEAKLLLEVIAELERPRYE